MHLAVFCSPVRYYKPCLHLLLIMTLGLLPKFLPAGSPPAKLYHMAPSHWYIGYADPELEIILHAENVSMIELQMEAYDGVEFVGKVNTINRHVCYLQLKIAAGAKPGFLKFYSRAQVQVRGLRYIRPFTFQYELKARSAQNRNKIGLNSSDLLYRLNVDRFANGNPKNDQAAVKMAARVDRNDPAARHGGDLAGVASHLPYLRSLGMTALWLNPVFSAEQPSRSYTGEGVTDHYVVDPRLGGNAEYLKLSTEAHKAGFKLIMEIQPNHFGSFHWMYENFDTGWFNRWDSFTPINYGVNPAYDPYAAASERELNLKGWTDASLPDLNQHDPHMQRYLDQVYLFWVEYAGLDGYSIAGWPYADPGYMQHLLAILQLEYPGLGYVGLIQSDDPSAQAAFVRNQVQGFGENMLPGLSDYALGHAISEGLNENFGTGTGLERIYRCLAEDFLYQDPGKNCILLDGPGLDRTYTHLGQDLNKWKMGMALLMTLRGIPGIYYGTEILKQGNAVAGEDLVNSDFPGGWKADKQNKFEMAGRNNEEKMAWDHLATLANYRRVNTVLQSGQTMHYAPREGVYVYFRYNSEKTVIVICNQSGTQATVDLERFSERIAGYSQARNILNNQVGDLGKSFNIRPMTVEVLELLP